MDQRKITNILLFALIVLVFSVGIKIFFFTKEKSQDMPAKNMVSVKDTAQDIKSETYSFNVSEDNITITNGKVLKKIILADIPPQSTNISKGGNGGFDNPSRDYIFSRINDTHGVIFDQKRQRVYFLVYNKNNTASLDLKVMMYTYDTGSGKISLVIPPAPGIAISDNGISPDDLYLFVSNNEIKSNNDPNCIGLLTGWDLPKIYNLVSGKKIADIESPQSTEPEQSKFIKLIGWKSSNKLSYQVFTVAPVFGGKKLWTPDTRCSLEEEKTLEVRG
jgi:hypothetical protein